jgi:hypothetical protein
MILEEPDIKLAGFSVWVFDREFPEANDFWDGNWLNVRVRMEAPGAIVEATGKILRNTELEAFADELASLESTLVGEARLKCMEPNLGVELKATTRGQIDVTVNLTPDHMVQSHKFRFGLTKHI